MDSHSSFLHWLFHHVPPPELTLQVPQARTTFSVRRAPLTCGFGGNESKLALSWKNPSLSLITGIHKQLFSPVFNFSAAWCICCRNVLAWAVQSKHSPVQSVDSTRLTRIQSLIHGVHLEMWYGPVWDYGSEERVANASKKGKKQRDERREQNPKSVIQIATCAMCKLESHQDCILKHFLQCIYAQLQCAAVLPWNFGILRLSSNFPRHL